MGDMTTIEAVRQAVDTSDARLAGAVADALRFERGFNYDRVFVFAHDHTGVSPEEWERLLYEADIEQ